eukprot:CAMPEP_0181083288 /NCGR_PEP_ID=MMETSP1071-20121207/4079_1 /TAXON_ID=35127 /ORGANISM="Thalassiosira sp., Strain NH16" /LENGTH=75 /DNA_ID=CAMNT_0023164939 /DNA_START=179 /DNA_END=402 /DNA_ORIENTATION=+
MGSVLSGYDTETTAMLASASASITVKCPSGIPFCVVKAGDVSYSTTKLASSTLPILLGRSHAAWREVALWTVTTT